MKALVFSTFGDADVLQYTTVPDPTPVHGEILVEMKAIGLNYADIYRRRGNYHLKGNPPYIAGYEGAGVVIDNNGLADFNIGDRIGFADVPFANAEIVRVPATHAIKLPHHVTFELAASVLLQGLTAHYLVTDSHAVSEGQVVVIHAASGGVGQLLTQMSKMKGARVIGLTTSEEKKAIITKMGADAAYNLKDHWTKHVLAFTNDKGADVVYDSIGTTLHGSIDVVKAGSGKVVFYGKSGGEPPMIDPRKLMDESKTITGGDLWSYLTTSEERVTRAGQLFSWIHQGKIKITPPVLFPLSEGKEAHRFLESGKSAGKVLLIP